MVWEAMDSDIQFPSKTWTAVIDRLPHYAALVDGLIQPGPLDEVTWVADGLVGDDLSSRLVDCSVALEELARKESNWHPGTDGRVLNLIDPSMHAMTPGQTLILKTPFMPGNNEDGFNLVHFLSKDEVDGHRIASEFQWLPADVEVDLDGSVHFTSYVNNLNPSKHETTYEVLEEILSTAFVPMWQKLLTERMREQKKNKLEKNDGWSNENQVEPKSGPISVDLKGRKIQIIIRMATTHLAPGENSRHPGGQWHIEGAPHEKIVAVGLHYYSNKNITTAKLGLGEKFKTQVTNAWGVTRHIFRDVSEMCTIETNEGRSVVFSNELNHCVLPFELENPELPGHRKILAFFLVDPGTPIISTAQVPCQQKSWYVSELKKIFISMLPEEMVDKVLSFLDISMDLELKKAKEARDALRKDRIPMIKVRVISQDAIEINFRLRPSTQIGKLKRAFADRLGVPSESLRLLFDGRRIHDEETPDQLEMETEDEIEVYQEQTD